MQSKDLAYEWNDVALLTDQRAYTFVCKTMLHLAGSAVEALQEILLADWQYQAAQNEARQFAGSMTLQLTCMQQQQRKELQVEIPLQGELQEPLTEQSSARLLYSKGQLAGDCLLLETALQIPRAQQLQRSQVILGKFSMEEMLELPQQWPGIQEVLTTAVALQIDSVQIAQQQLCLAGRYRLSAVYENQEQPGEHIFAYEQQRPMTAALPIPPGLQELDGVQPYYQTMTAQLLDDRHILLAGEGVLCTGAASGAGEGMEEKQKTDSIAAQVKQETLTRQMAEILQQLLAQLEQRGERTGRRAQGASNSLPEERGSAGQETLNAEAEKAAAPAGNSAQSGAVHPSVVSSRGLRRANLSKYMRHLNSSVQTPKSTRNFEIGAEQESAAESEEAGEDSCS